MTAVTISKFIGLTALYLLTTNILLGLLVSSRYNTVKRWPHRHINIFRWHNRTGYVALGIAICHPVTILFSSTAHFRILDITIPLWSPSQPVENTIGAVALYSVSFVVVTSYFRKRLGFPLWKRFHYVAYASAVLFFVHGLMTDPQLKHRRLDPLDAEKVSVETCILLVAGGTWMRARYAVRTRRIKAASAAARLTPASGGDE